MGKAPKKDRQFWESASKNDLTYLHYYNYLTELAVSMIKWKNLPPTVDERFLELALFADGMAVFFKDEVLGFLALRTMIGGQLNVYQIPNTRRAYASNGYNRDLDETNSVIIFNNRLHTNSTMEVDMYAEKLYDIDRAIIVNSKAQKTPVLIMCDENQRLTMKNMYMQYEGNSPVIYGDSNLNPNSMKVFKTDAPFVADRLYSLKTEIWNEAISYFGISNVNNTKKERMVVDEVIRNQGGVVASRYSRLEARKQACEMINEMFGTNISCDFRDDFQLVEPVNLETEEDNENEEEGETVNE